MTAMHEEDDVLNISLLCRLFGKSRQAYYQQKTIIVSQQQRTKLILDSVDSYRAVWPRLGCLKLHALLQAELGREITRGRDSFLALLRRNGYTLPMIKRHHTTNSNHIYRKYPNLVKGIAPQNVNHILVSDITYIFIQGDVLYLHLVTDAYSHAIIGYCLSDTLEAEHTIKALEMAIQNAGGGNLCGTIHHSDRGVQYASDRYVSLLTEHHIRISMTEDYNPTDNAIAERINGILKSEALYPMGQLPDREQAEEVVNRLIDFYNHKRPHMSIGNLVPWDVYIGAVPHENLWKKSHN